MLKWLSHSYKCTNLWLFIDNVSSKRNYSERRKFLIICPLVLSHLFIHAKMVCVSIRDFHFWPSSTFPGTLGFSLSIQQKHMSTNLELILTPHLCPVQNPGVGAISHSGFGITRQVVVHTHPRNTCCFTKKSLLANIPLRPVHLYWFLDILWGKIKKKKRNWILKTEYSRTCAIVRSLAVVWYLRHSQE